MPGYQDPDCTVFVSNVEGRVTEEHLWELFLQAGPLRNVHIPTDKGTGKNKTFAFITFRDECSVPFACELFNKLMLYKKPIYCKPTKDGKHAASTGTQFTTPERPLDINQSFGRYDAHNTPSESPQTPNEHVNTRRDYSNKRGYNSYERKDIHRPYDSRNMNGGHFSNERENFSNSYNDRGNRGRYDNHSRSHGGDYHRDNQRNIAPNSPNVNISPLLLEAVSQSINHLRQQGGQGRSPQNNQSHFGPMRHDHSRQRDNRRHYSHPY